MKLSTKLAKIASVIALLVLPVVAFAQPVVPGARPSGFATWSCNTVTTCSATVIQILLAVVFIIAVIFLVIGGFRYIVSQGNEEGVEKAKGTIVNAIIGIVVVLLAWIVLQVVVNLLSNAGGTT